MSILTKTKIYKTEKKMHMYVIDKDINDVIKESKIQEGFILVFVSNVSAAVTITEAEPGIMTHDLDYLFSYGMNSPYGPGFKDGTPYKHHETWGCDNGASHLRSLMIGPSVTIPILDGKPMLEVWQNVVLVECDTHNRTRKVVFQVHGE